ncbi:SLAP domain-containing protein [Anoxybacillus ayderensis]|uniref:S-layer homology domain-containing protein n=1 Tax=Anoxybacillus sp. ST70 TaxID=2864180 RepID=UPI0002D8AA75|nr:S-layer homology domain-containing protein [Anoxybacillus sp. ST70]AXM89920.1 SLAP domain-containing protein [Anoxybacillus ayderensis G10]MBW9219656.1 S-layer homology domain-containing protein [Anoxybacillus sp. ST70]THD16981.1 SLAP domain-containing protein [Anoxybacillus ayderensis]
MKRLFLQTLLFCTSLLFLSSISPVAATGSFSDVNSSHWAYDEINYLVNKKIINEKNKNFFPNLDMKRIEAAEMLVKALGLDTKNRPNPNFKDIKPGDYGYEYVATLADEGIMVGNNGYFKPRDTLTRGQMAKIIAESYHLDYVFGSEFDDIDKDSWLYDYVSCLVDNYITTGYPDNKYRPSHPVKRSQFSVVLARLLDDSFKQTILFKPISNNWKEDGSLVITVEIKNNLPYPVEVNDSLIVVTNSDEWIAREFFEFEPNELYLKAKQSKQLDLIFSPYNFYDASINSSTNLANIAFYAQTTISKK